MEFATLSLFVAFTALMVTLFGAFIELKSIRITKGIQTWLGHESEVVAMERDKQPSIVEEFDAYLSEFDEDTKMTRLQAMGKVMGDALASYFRFSKMQKGSVDAKLQKKYDGQVLEGLQKMQPVEYKVAKKLAAKFGFNIDDVLERDEQEYLQKAFQKHGIGLDTSGASPGPNGENTEFSVK